MLKQPRRNSRIYSALAVVAGLIFLGFEIRRLLLGDGEAWFWAIVGGLIVLLGMAGVLQRNQPENDPDL
jgi:hypothetical protein